jgi:CRISPR-associated protein Cmr6
MIPHRLLEKNTGLTVDNVGLAISRLAPADHKLFGNFVRHRLAPAPLPSSYNQAFRRFQRRTPPGVSYRRVFQAKASSSVLCGMGEASPGENSLSLHPVYGTPYLPGTSLKGVARAWCTQRFLDGPWAPGGESFNMLFGSEEPTRQSGVVDFLDALLVPTTEAPYLAEVLTPHNGKYYQGKGAPTGFEGPIPVIFLGTIGSFRMVIEGPPEWIEAAERVLIHALAEHGVGSKTRAGHGRLVYDKDNRHDDNDKATLSRLRLAEEQQRFARMNGADKIRHILEKNSTNEQSLGQDIVRWVEGETPQITLLRTVEHDQDAWVAVVEWLKSKNFIKRWERQKSEGKKKAPRATVLLDHIAPYRAATLATAKTPAAEAKPDVSTELFGTQTLPARLTKVEKSKKKRTKQIQKLENAMKRTGTFTEESIRQGLQVLEANNYKESAIESLRALYGL